MAISDILVPICQQKNIREIKMSWLLRDTRYATSVEPLSYIQQVVTDLNPGTKIPA